MGFCRVTSARNVGHLVGRHVLHGRGRPGLLPFAIDGGRRLPVERALAGGGRQLPDSRHARQHRRVDHQPEHVGVHGGRRLVGDLPQVLAPRVAKPGLTDADDEVAGRDQHHQPDDEECGEDTDVQPERGRAHRRPSLLGHSGTGPSDWREVQCLPRPAGCQAVRALVTAPSPTPSFEGWRQRPRLEGGAGDPSPGEEPRRRLTVPSSCGWGARGVSPPSPTAPLLAGWRFSGPCRWRMSTARLAPPSRHGRTSSAKLGWRSTAPASSDATAWRAAATAPGQRGGWEVRFLPIEIRSTWQDLHLLRTGSTVSAENGRVRWLQEIREC